MLWVWINLLPFALANQSQPLAILEDKINKPWRPLPSSIITPRAARWLMFWSYAAALLISIALRCELQCVALMILGGLYNDLGGADSNCVFRNLLNAAGYTSFASGATVVAITPSSLNKLAYKWFGMILLIVFSTVQVQDMQDQDGDRIRGRKTVPLVIGDWKARWTVAIGVSLWSFAAPTFWEASLAGYAAPVVLGLFVAHRVLSKHTCQEDARTFKLWNIWIMTVYLVPLVKRLTGATNWPAQS